MSPTSLHPAENRGYRELYVSAQELSRHWSSLVELIGDADVSKALNAGVSAADRLLRELGELTPQYGLHGEHAARGLGARVGGVRSTVRDRFLERNQALRLALLEVQHMRTLVTYLTTIAEARADETLETFGKSWQRKLTTVERQMRTAAVDSGRNPDLAVAPLDPSTAGRAGQRVAYSVGAVGEWIDRRMAGRT